MENPELWLTPLILLPGVGMLIMSTSVRFNRLHDEVHHLIREQMVDGDQSAHLFKRAEMFRNALVSLYICVSLFSIAGLLGGLSVVFPILYWFVVAIVCFGITSLIYSSIQLIRESIISLEVINKHKKNLS